ncbi:CPBP family intramembrane glutamic endopeptidase [Marinicella litoralis]|nr:CPBP family intramembrane glutamic endopeptidase [Marinicella litoralis]
MRYSKKWAQSLHIIPIPFNWTLIALLFGLSYWQIDQWLMSYLLQTDRQADITAWQQNTANYHPISLFISSVLFAPVFEELVFRGLMLRALLQKANGFISVTMTALLFAAIHLSWPEAISVFAVGLIYGWMTVKSKSLIPALLAHITHNALTYWQYASA